MTIYEVAREARVSASTVSNVINGKHERMGAATKTRVEAAIQRLNYSPNRAARQLRTGGIDSIGLVVPSVSNPYWGTFASLFENAALKLGYGVLLCNSRRDEAHERSYLEELSNNGVRGVVLGSSLPSMKHVEPLIRRGMRVVTLDRSRQSTDPQGLMSVSVDNAGGAAMAAEHLWELGHRRFAFIAGEIQSINRRERLEGFLGALELHGVARDDVTVWREGHSGTFDDSEVGREAARTILFDPKQAITAIAAVNDLCAIGAYRGVRDAGLSVGTDIAVVGFDDIALAQLIYPTLTTVHQPLAQLAELTLDCLVREIDDPSLSSVESFRLPARMVIRESSMSRRSL